MSRDVALRGLAIGVVAAIGGVAAGLAAAGRPAPVAALCTAAALVFGALVGYVALYRSANAVHAVSVAAERIAAGDLGERVHAGPGPVGELTHAFNTMASRVQKLFEGISAEQARLEAVFNSSGDPMVAVSRDGRVCFLNRAAAHLFETSLEAAIGRPFIELARDYELYGIVRQAVAEDVEAAPAVITFGARRVPLRVAALPIRGGGEWDVLLVLTDLTEVQRVDQVRRDFVSNVSHELRTPLASIRGLVETLENGAVDTPEEQAEFLARIRQQVDRLTALVSELLDLSRIESGALVLTPENVRLGEIVAEATSLLRTRAEAQDVRFKLPDSSEGEIEADRASLLRVVTNLLDNAIKYSPAGGCVAVSLDEDGGLVGLTVRDEGPGLPEPELTRVFERFYKGESSRASAGTGLGLAIVKHLVRAHGGTATAESTPGQGAAFTVRLPKRFVGRR